MLTTNLFRQSATMTYLKYFQQGLLIIALLIMTAHVLVYIGFGVALIPFPFDYDQAEGFELNNAILMAKGDCPYCNNDSFPFYGSGYPPFYHIVMIPLVWIFGPAYWYGRLLVFLSTFVTAGAIGYAVHRETRHTLISLLAGMAFLASNFIYHIGPLLRQHLFMVMLETLAIVLLAQVLTIEDQRKRRHHLILGMILLGMAGYTKQLAIATVIGVFVWLFIRNPRRAIVYGIGLTLGVGVFFGFWMIVTDGEWWTNIIASNVNPFVPGQLSGLLRLYVRLHWAIVFMAGLVVLYEFYFTRVSLYSVWFIAASLNTLTAGKWGAGDSYFATSLAAACLLAGIFVGRTLQRQWTFPANFWLRFFEPFLRPLRRYSQLIGQSVGIAGIGLFIIYGMTVVKLPTDGLFFDELSEWLGVEPKPDTRYAFYDSATWTVGYAVTGHLPLQKDYDNGQAILDRVKQTDKPIITEDAGFSIQADKAVVTNPIQLRNLWLNGLYDPTALMQMIDAQEFGLIIFRGQGRFFPDPVLNAIYDAYDPEQYIEMNGFIYELWSESPIVSQRHQLRDFVWGGQSGTVSVSIPAMYIADHETWLIEHLNRWGNWQLLEILSSDATCENYHFGRGEQRLTASVCTNALFEVNIAPKTVKIHRL